MKIRLLFPVALIIVFACAAWTESRSKKKPKYTISGTILINQAYCGGARIDESERRPQPAAGTTLYIRRAGSPQVIDSVVTDSTGKFSINLYPGNYCFVEKWKTEKFEMPANTQYEQWDTTCYKNEYQKCDYALLVKSKKSDVKITLPRYCAWSRPCCTYRGPLPPSAPPTNRGGYQPGHQE